MAKNFKSLFFENIGIKQTVVKNTFWLTISELIPRVMIAILVILIARYLGVEGFGKFSFAFAFVALFSVIADFGLAILTTRDIARNISLAKKYIDNIIVIKFILGVITFGAIISALVFLDKTIEIKILIFLAGVWMVVQSFNRFFQSIFRAFEKMEYEALSKIIYSIILFAAVICAINLNLGIKSLMQSYIFAILISLAVTAFVIRIKFVKFKIEIDLLFWKNLLKEAWPFGIFTIFAVIYFQISTVLLSLMDTDVSVGLYSIAFNSVVVFLILADVVSGSALPTLTKLFGKSSLFGHLTKKLIIFLLITGLLLAIILFFGAPLLIKLIYGGEFMGAVAAFQVMVWILPLRFMNYLFAVSLIAANLQKKRLNAAIICAFLNVLINLILIPNYSFMGAAIATLVTEIILFFLYFSFYKAALLPKNNFNDKILISNV